MTMTHHVGNTAREYPRTSKSPCHIVAITTCFRDEAKQSQLPSTCPPPPPPPRTPKYQLHVPPTVNGATIQLTLIRIVLVIHVQELHFLLPTTNHAFAMLADVKSSLLFLRLPTMPTVKSMLVFAVTWPVLLPSQPTSTALSFNHMRLVVIPSTAQRMRQQ